MADILKNLFGGAPKPAQKPVSDDDFADFAGAPDPSPVSISPVTSIAGTAPTSTSFGTGPRPYTKWYRVWERTERQDFITEAFILPFIIVIVLVHLWGTRKNKRKAKSWAQSHIPILQNEFAVVGYSGVRRGPSEDDDQESSSIKALESSGLTIPADLVKNKSAAEFSSYASGRQNVAYVDMKILLNKRYNPLMWFGEWLFSLFFDSIPAPIERMEAIAYTFDGKEKDIVPPTPSGSHGTDVVETRSKGASSTYDGFVWAVVNKESMRKLRDDRYDVSLTYTKDHPKLPPWATVMTEAAEVTDTLMTNDLIKALEEAGDNFEYLIVTDQPVDKPKTIDETVPRKRLHLSIKLPSSASPSAYKGTLPLFSAFLRFPDQLTSQAHFRPEVLRRVKSTREEQVRKLKRVDEEEKQEERNLQRDKTKKADRDKKLRGMSSEEQKKFLDREREKDQKKQEKRMTRRG